VCLWIQFCLGSGIFGSDERSELFESIATVFLVYYFKLTVSFIALSMVVIDRGNHSGTGLSSHCLYSSRQILNSHDLVSRILSS
jgi:hypothetical protein